MEIRMVQEKVCGVIEMNYRLAQESDIEAICEIVLIGNLQKKNIML